MGLRQPRRACVVEAGQRALLEVIFACSWRVQPGVAYAAPADPGRPQVCFDELPYQLVSEVRAPLPAAPGQVERYDYEYRREGTCNLFVTFAPHLGWRHVAVTAHRTAVDFAGQMKWL